MVRKIPKIKTQEDIDYELNDLVGDEYTFLEPYINSREKMSIVHNVCGHEYKVCWNNFKTGRRCPNCSRRLTDREFKDRVRAMVGNEYVFLEPYSSTGRKMRVLHNIAECKHEYMVTPNHFLKGRRCPKCWFSSKRKTTNEFKQEVFELVGDEYIPISKYLSSRDKIKMHHKRCNKSYKVVANDFLQGNRCPYCRRSKGELRISNFLTNSNIKFAEEVSFNGFNGGL